MLSFLSPFLLSLLALQAAGRSQDHQIPEVDAAVSQALKEFSAYTAYQGPTGVAAADIASATPQSRVLLAQAAVADPAYWLANINHQGKAAFNSDSTYKVWRNVMDFGAKGDGVTDDTAAINAAIYSGNRCAPGVCQSSTNTLAVVYFPAGTYLVSTPIIDYYYTVMIGNPNSRAVIKASAGFSGAAVIDANPYQSTGNQGYGSTNVFFRQIRNLVIDLTAIPASSAATALHWPTSQATNLQNIQVNLSQASGTQHVGIFIENGSAGFISDVVVYGGRIAFNIGNQQYTLRNIKIYNSVTAIYQLWSWGFTYKSLSITNCTIGIDMSATNEAGTAQLVGSVTVLDSDFTNTPTGIKTSQNTAPSPATAGTLIVENLALSNVPVAVQSTNGATILAGGTTTITAWGHGHQYTPNGPTNLNGPYTAPSRPASLVSGNKYYEKGKPQYETLAVANFLSVRTLGGVGDGVTDDTAAVQNAINQGISQGKVVFFDAGTYKVTDTIYIPPGSRIVGEGFSVIMSSGAAFNNYNSPRAVVQVGKSGESGSVEWSDMIVSTQGAQAGAIVVEWNLAATSGSGMWDVHARIGGFAGSQLGLAQCPTNAAVSSSCYSAYMLLHITTSASGAYIENCWFWTADHDLDSGNSERISIYTARGVLVESTNGPTWLVGTGSEHNALYQYQFTNTKNLFIGFAQTETPYWMPNPDAKNQPFALVSSLSDPNYATLCPSTGNCDSLGLRITGSSTIYVYGAGLYSFFNNYNTTCSDAGNPEDCQSFIFSVENSNNVIVLDYSTVGATTMITKDGTAIARYSDNINVYPDTIALFRTA